MRKNESAVGVKEIEPIFPDDYKIIRRVEADGTVIYEHPSVGGGVTTEVEELDFLLRCAMERLESTALLITGDTDNKNNFYPIFVAVAEQIERQLYEIFEFIGSTLGQIKCTIISDPEKFYRVGRCVGVSLTPPEERIQAKS